MSWDSDYTQNPNRGPWLPCPLGRAVLAREPARPGVPMVLGLFHAFRPKVETLNPKP